MPPSSRIATLVATAGLALSPAAALAQNGAGDQQYSDPFSGQSTSPKPGQAGPGKPKASTPAQSTAPSTSQTQAAPAPSTAPATPSAPVAAAPAATSAQLPRTGFDALPLALLGVAMIGAGALLLRRRADARD